VAVLVEEHAAVGPDGDEEGEKEEVEVEEDGSNCNNPLTNS
jgi:hypothetical protein